MSTADSIISESEKIAILVPNYASYSGDARVVELQANDYAAAGKKVTIFTFFAGIPSEHEVIELGMPKSLFWQRVYRLLFFLDLLKINKFVNILKDYDLVISHLYPMNILGYFAKKQHGIKYGYWYHGISPASFFPLFHERMYTSFFIWLTSTFTKNADFIVSVSNHAKKEFFGYSGLDSEVVYNKPDLSRFHPNVDPSIIREKYGFEDSKVILNVGRLAPNKGAHLLIDAFKLVQEKVDNVKLIIVGKPTYDYYFEQIKENSNESVVLTGFVSDEDLPYYYAGCDLYATCSFWEANNVPVLEAHASGKSIVAFDFDFFKEEYEEGDILVEQYNIEKFAEACIAKLGE